MYGTACDQQTVLPDLPSKRIIRTCIHRKSWIRKECVRNRLVRVSNLSVSRTIISSLKKPPGRINVNIVQYIVYNRLFLRILPSCYVDCLHSHRRGLISAGTLAPLRLYSEMALRNDFEINKTVPPMQNLYVYSTYLDPRVHVFFTNTGNIKLKNRIHQRISIFVLYFSTKYCEQ